MRRWFARPAAFPPGVIFPSVSKSSLMIFVSPALVSTIWAVRQNWRALSALLQQMAGGAYDLVSCTGAYYDALLPEADALKLLEIHPAKLRLNGGFEYVAALHRAKNIEYLGRHQSSMPFHLYLGDGKLITRADSAWPASSRRTDLHEFLSGHGGDHPALQYHPDIALYEGRRGRRLWLAGHWSTHADWREVTRYRVDPGFYDADLHLLFNREAFEEVRPSAPVRCCAILPRRGKAKAMILIRRRSKRLMSEQRILGIEAIVLQGDDRARLDLDRARRRLGRDPEAKPRTRR